MLTSTVREAARRFGELSAFVDPAGIRLSYHELDECSDAVARSMGALGVRPGDRVVLRLPSTIEYVLAVVREVHLEVAAGEVVALLGPNGAGKTTTISALSGMINPRAGVVRWRGSPTRTPLHRRCCDGLGLVTEGRAVLMNLTVEQNLRVARADRRRVLELFPELGEHLGRKVGLLSGGQQQMLALGQALGRRPAVLLADELSLGLAPLVVERLLKAVRAAADDGLGVLLVEQHVHKAMQIADRVASCSAARFASPEPPTTFETVSTRSSPRTCQTTCRPVCSERWNGAVRTSLDETAVHADAP